tara:strand:+ start:384 stop:746 length:363 start_codon:yes stop_codon:yes gene_type:complete
MTKYNWVPKCSIKRYPPDEDFDKNDPKKRCEKGKGTHLLNVGVHVETLREWLAERVREGTHVNAKGYITLCITENKNGPTEWGATHGAYLSEFIPKAKEGKAAPTSSEPSSELTADEIPF